MSGTIKPPDQMDFGGDLVENWKYFEDQWTFYLIRIGAQSKESPSENVLVATLLSCMGKECYKIYTNLNLKDEDRKSCSKIIQALRNYFLPKRNKWYERYIFINARQEPGESFLSYLNRLQYLASSCEFSNQLEEYLILMIIFGITDDELRRQLLSDHDLRLNVVVDKCVVWEATNNQISQIQSKKEGEVNKVTTGRDNDKNMITNCTYCTYDHPRGRCPAFGQSCSKCGRANHFAKACKSKPTTNRNRTGVKEKFVKGVKKMEDSGSLENYDEEGENILKIDNLGPDKDKFMVNLNFRGKEGTKVIRCQLDTGASCDVMSYDTFVRLGSDLKTSKIKLRCYDGTIINPIGQSEIPVEYKNQNSILNFQIVDNQEIPLISARSCCKLKLIDVCADLCKIEELPNSKNQLMLKYNKVFEGLGRIGDMCHLEVDSNVRPIQAPPRRVPVPLRGQLQDILKELEQTGVIKKVSKPTPWISNIVLIKKGNKPRLCLDPSNLNKVLISPRFQMPTIEEILPNLSGARYFSILDAKNGFWQVELDEASSLLTTFWTPFGRYCWMRMPFGLCVASEEYQRRQYEVLQGLPGIEAIADDILVIGKGKTDKEALENHDENLDRLLKRCQEMNLKLNIKKAKIRCTEAKYIGHILSKDGIRPDPEKVKALKEMEKPKTQKELQRFIGMVVYLGKFIPKLSDLLKPLRDIQKINTTKLQEIWTEDHNKVFERVKQKLSIATALQYYNLNKPVVVQCDASQYGLGAVIMQEDKPITFASRTLTKTEQNYCQLEKECLAIFFAFNRFDQYLAGKSNVTVETDHKPLEVIFKKPILNMPKRLQTMILKLQRYSFVVKYRKGRDMIAADTFSRAPLSNFGSEKERIPLETVNQLDQAKISTEGMEKIKLHTAKDQKLQELIKVIMDGWPNNNRNLPAFLAPFWAIKDELTFQDGVIIKGSTILIPETMRKDLIEKLHVAHQGLDSTLRRARESVYWPNMKNEIKMKIQNCNMCNKYKPRQHREPLRSHEISELPWNKIGIDLCELKGQYYMVVVDYYSDFIEMERLQSITSTSIISICKRQFARYGIPEQIISDNGRQFMCEEFKEFCKKNGIQHNTSSPNHPQGNGKAESAVKIIKNTLKKSMENKEEFWEALLAIRNTPDPIIGSSPVQRLMGRRTRTGIPTLQKKFYPETQENALPNILKKREKSRKNYDQDTKELVEIKPGETIRVKLQKDLVNWSKGTMVKKVCERSYIVEVDGKLYRRNRIDIRKTGEMGREEDSEAERRKDEPGGGISNSRRVGDIDVNRGAEHQSQPPSTVPDVPPSTSTDHPNTTRSGRIVRSPRRYVPGHPK